MKNRRFPVILGRRSRRAGRPLQLSRPARLLLVFLVLAAPGASSRTPAGSQAPPSSAGRSNDPADTVRRRVRYHLESGRVEAALAAAQTALKAHPNDAVVREEVVELHVSLAGVMLSEESYTAAERCLWAALKIDSDHDEARRLSRTLATARERVPERVAAARRWIEIEWFEPAFTTLRQAGALLPDERHTWDEAYLAAAIGAGDDHYFTKTFHEAFYYYDAALALGAQLGAPSTAALDSRWLQSMIHALGQDVDKAAFPPEYWSTLLARAEPQANESPGGPQLLATLEGLAQENLGLIDEAASRYARVLDPAAADGANVKGLRLAALGALRPLYNADTCGRRGGIWAEHAAGEWQSDSVPRFTIFHRNPSATERVSTALRFHFRRIADALVLDEAEIPWPKSCELFLHADAAAFAQATGQPEHVRGLSLIRVQGGKLQGHAIHVSQDDPLLLSATLAHELAHLMVAAATNYRPLRPVLSEGMALAIEPQCRQRQFARLFRELKRPRTIDALLAVDEVHPPDPEHYAQAHRLVSVLLTRGDLTTALDAGVRAQSAKDLAWRFGFKDAAALASAFTAQRN